MTNPTWKEKYFVVDNKRKVDDEMIELDLEIDDIIEILDTGKEVRKRERTIIERWLQKGIYIYIVAVEDCEEYWLIRHAGKIKASKRKLKLLRRC